MSDDNAKDPQVEALLKALTGGNGSPDEPFMVLGGEDGQPVAEPEPQEEEVLLLEDQLVEITGKSGPEEDSPEITVRGRIRGLAPINTPFGIIGFDYIVALDNPSELPTSDPDKPYGYSCITAPKEICKPVEE